MAGSAASRPRSRSSRRNSMRHLRRGGDVEVQHILPSPELCIERYGCGITWIGLHEDHTCAAQRGNSLELRDQCGGNTLSPMRSSHCQVVDVDLASFLLELGKHVGRESPDNFFVFQGSDRDESIASKQPLHISLAGLGAPVGVRLLKRLAEQGQHGPHQSSVIGTETSNGARDNGWQSEPPWVVRPESTLRLKQAAKRLRLNEMLGLRSSAGIGSSSC